MNDRLSARIMVDPELQDELIYRIFSVRNQIPVPDPN